MIGSEDHSLALVSKTGTGQRFAKYQSVFRSNVRFAREITEQPCRCARCAKSFFAVLSGLTNETLWVLSKRLLVIIIANHGVAYKDLSVSESGHYTDKPARTPIAAWRLGKYALRPARPRAKISHV
jgi:hypothetical protein